MSSSERQRQSKRLKTSCASCRARKALFKYRGEVRADRDHTLCFECYRAELNRARAKRLIEPLQSTMAAGGGYREHRRDEQDAGRLAHRQRMLDHLKGQSEIAS